MTTWYAFRVQSQKEFVAETILRRRGFHALVPSEHKLRRKSRYSRKKDAVKYPMLIGYVLAGFDGDVPWWDLYNTSVIKSVVGFDGKPMPLPEHDITSLLQKSTSYTPHNSSLAGHKGFQIGDTVQVSDGPLEGYMLKVEAIKGHQATVFFEMFGSLREMKLPTEILEGV